MATTQQAPNVAIEAQRTSQDAADQAANPAMVAAAELQRLELLQRMPSLEFCALVCRLSGDERAEIIIQFQRMGDVNRTLIAWAANFLATHRAIAGSGALAGDDNAQYLSVEEEPDMVTVSFIFENEPEPLLAYQIHANGSSVQWGSLADEGDGQEDDAYEEEEQSLDAASLAPVTGDESTWRVLGPGALAALALARTEPAALDPSVAKLVSSHPEEIQQILTIIRVRMGSRAVEAYRHMSDPERLQVPSDLHAIAILTKRIAALDAVIAQESATAPTAQAQPLSQGTPEAFGVVAAAHVERMDLEHSRDILATGKGRYEGANQESRLHKTWTMRQRDGRAIDCTTFPLKALADTTQSLGRPDLFDAFKNAMYQEWRDKTGSPKGAMPQITGMDLLIGLKKALGWQGFLISPDDEKLAQRKSWYRVPVDPKLAVTEFSSTSMQISLVRELPFAVISESGHMGLLVYGKWYEVHWSDTHDNPTLIEATDILSRATEAAAMAPAADVERVLRASTAASDE